MNGLLDDLCQVLLALIGAHARDRVLTHHRLGVLAHYGVHVRLGSADDLAGIGISLGVGFPRIQQLDSLCGVQPEHSDGDESEHLDDHKHAHESARARLRESRRGRA